MPRDSILMAAARTLDLLGRGLTDSGERLANEARCDAESIGDERVEDGPKGGHSPQLSCLNEYAEGSSDGNSARLRHFAADAFVDE